MICVKTDHLHAKMARKIAKMMKNAMICYFVHGISAMNRDGIEFKLKHTYKQQ